MKKSVTTPVDGAMAANRGRDWLPLAAKPLDIRKQGQAFVRDSPLMASRDGWALSMGDVVRPERGTASTSSVDLPPSARAETPGGATMGVAATLSKPLHRQEGTHTEVSVYYGTDRKQTDEGYGGTRQRPDGVMNYGVVEVSIPKDHQLAVLEAPVWWKFEFTPNREKHVVMGPPQPLSKEAFFTTLAAVAKQTDGQQALVFVHGFNVSFEDATRRTAQLAYDLQFNGVPLCYSWPSDGGLLDYPSDLSDAEWTVPHLSQFLEDVAAQGNIKKIYLVAHSMGNRALTSALTSLIQSRQSASMSRIESIVLAAPDIDADVFRTQIAPVLTSTGKPLTLYASATDRALLGAKKAYKSPRAGDAGAGLVVIDGIETIDASKADTSFLGHSYYGDSQKVVSDLFEVLTYGLPAIKRNFLQPASRGNLKYFEFK